MWEECICGGWVWEECMCGGCEGRCAYVEGVGGVHVGRSACGEECVRGGVHMWRVCKKRFISR